MRGKALMQFRECGLYFVLGGGTVGFFELAEEPAGLFYPVLSVFPG